MTIETKQVISIEMRGAINTSQPDRASMDVTPDEFMYLMERGSLTCKVNSTRTEIIKRLAAYHATDEVITPNASTEATLRPHPNMTEVAEGDVESVVLSPKGAA